MNSRFEDAVVLYVVYKRATARLLLAWSQLPYEARMHLSFMETCGLGFEVLLRYWSECEGVKEEDFDCIADASGLPVQKKVDEVVAQFLQEESISGVIFSSVRTN